MCTIMQQVVRWTHASLPQTAPGSVYQLLRGLPVRLRDRQTDRQRDHATTVTTGAASHHLPVITTTMFMVLLSSRPNSLREFTRFIR